MASASACPLRQNGSAKKSNPDFFDRILICLPELNKALKAFLIKGGNAQWELLIICCRAFSQPSFGITSFLLLQAS
jgi:hypothetical protein